MVYFEYKIKIQTKGKRRIYMKTLRGKMLVTILVPVIVIVLIVAFLVFFQVKSQ